VEIWREILQVEAIGIDHNFFELGGHSLKAIRVRSRINKAFGVDFPLTAFFDGPTVAAMAKVLEASGMLSAGASEQIPIARADRNGDLPLSYAQERLWFLSQLEPDNPFYNVPAAVRLTGDLDLAALANSFNAIVRRHEMLRTSFQTFDARPAQVIAPEVELSLPVIDISRTPARFREAELKRIASEEARRPFDLSSCPLIRVALVKLGRREHAALVTMHHIISDAWSMGVLIGELMENYEAYMQGKPSSLEELPIQYADYAVWQRERLRGERLEQELGYWKRQLAGAPALLKVSNDMDRPEVASYRGETRYFEIEGEVMEGLRKLSQEEEATLFMTLLAGYKVMLSHYSGEEDIVVGTPVSGRSREELEGLIGFFVNTLALRTKLKGEASFRELVRKVKDVAIGAYEHQEAPLAKIVEELNPERKLGYSPIFQVCFYLGNAPAPTLKLPGLTLAPLEMDRQAAQFDLVFGVTEMERGALGVAQYSADLFSPSTISNMINDFGSLLKKVATDAESRVNELKRFFSQSETQMHISIGKELEDISLSRLGQIKRRAVGSPIFEGNN
jgi:hypothetical protein